MSVNPKTHKIMLYAMSLKPEYVQAFKEGRKTIEIRTSVPRYIQPGDLLVVVETGTGGQVPMHLRVKGKMQITPKALWENHRQRLAISEEEFQKYTKGRSWLNCIMVDAVYTFNPPFRREQYGLLTSPQWFTAVTKVPNLDERRLK